MIFPWGRRFFGLTTVPKIDLFLREIQAVMKVYQSMSFWDAYLLPVAIRKWLLDEHNRQMADEEKQGRQQQPSQSRPAFTPLSQQEKSTARQAQPMMPSVKK